MNLKTIINIIPFIGVLVMVLWGTLGDAWNISWVAAAAGGVLMAILSVINSGQEKSKKEKESKEFADK